MFGIKWFTVGLIVGLGHIRCLIGSAPDCATVNVETLVPILDPSPASTEIVTFAPDLARLFDLLSTIGDPGFSAHSELDKFITTKDINVCHRLGKPMEWDDVGNSAMPGAHFTLLTGYFGRATSGKPASKTFEACQFGKTTLFGAAQCNATLQSKANAIGREFQGYGEVDNKILVMGVRKQEHRWLEIGADNDSPIACLATPLTNMITKLETLSKDVYCLVDNMFHVIGHSEVREGCTGVRYQLAKHRLSNVTNWEAYIEEECAKLIQFECNDRTTRATSLENFVMTTINKHGIELLKKTILLINTVLIPRAPDTVTSGWPASVNYDETLTATDVFLAMRLSAKFMQMHTEDQIVYNKMYNWVTDVLTELKSTVNTILNNYQLLITKLTVDQLTCTLGNEALSLKCGSNALLKSFSAGKAKLSSNQLSYKLGSLFYVNCVSRNGINIAGNRQVYFRVNDTLVNENYTIPIRCLSTDTFTTQMCSHILSSHYSSNYVIENEVEILATGLDKIRLYTSKQNKVIDKNQNKYFPSTMYDVKMNELPILISGAGTFQVKLGPSTVLNQIGRKFILNYIKHELPSLRNFAIHFHKHNLHQIKQITWWEFIIANGKVVFGTTTGIVVFVVTLVLFMLIVTCRKRTKKQTDKIKQDALSSENCSMPWFKREVTVDKMEFRHDILELLRTQKDDVTTHGKLNPADTKLFNIVSKAVEKADKKAKQWLCADAKTQQDLMFEIGFILYEDLAKRMCACAFPVHVCVNDVTRAPAKHDGYRRMEQYLRDHVAKPTPSAPDAIELCN